MNVSATTTMPFHEMEDLQTTTKGKRIQRKHCHEYMTFYFQILANTSIDLQCLY